MMMNSKICVYGALFAFLCLLTLFSGCKYNTEAFSDAPTGGTSTGSVQMSRRYSTGLRSPESVPASESAAWFNPDSNPISPPVIATSISMSPAPVTSLPMTPSATSVSTAMAAYEMQGGPPGSQGSMTQGEVDMLSNALVGIVSNMPPITIQISSKIPLLGDIGTASVPATANASVPMPNTYTSPFAPDNMYQPFYRPSESISNNPTNYQSTLPLNTNEVYQSDYVPSYTRSQRM